MAFLIRKFIHFMHIFKVFHTKIPMKILLRRKNNKKLVKLLCNVDNLQIFNGLGKIVVIKCYR